MKCKYCKTEVEKDDLFCPNCGKQVVRGRQCIKCGEELEDDSDFCPHCGTQQNKKEQNSSKVRPQNTIKKQTSNSILSRPWTMILLFVLLCLGLYYLFFNPGGKEAEHNNLEEEAVSEQAPIDSDSIYQVNAVSEQLKEDSLMKVAKQKSDSLALLKDSLKNKGDHKQSSKKQASKAASPLKNRPSSRQATVGHNTVTQTGTKNLGYGTYRGTLVSGRPHGVNGRLVYNSTHLIDSRDPKGRVASPGDYVIGEFYEGHLVQGIWYDSNNQVKGSIILGR